MAATATWVAPESNPGNNWNTDANWSPAGVPTDTAIFAAAVPDTVIVSANASINTIQFDAGAAGYLILIGTTTTFDLNGSGIVNNSGSSQSLANNHVLNFNNASSAADADITNSGTLSSNNTATAADATVTNVDGTVSFSGNSMAGIATLTNSSGLISFSGNSTAGNATIDYANAGSLSFSG